MPEECSVCEELWRDFARAARQDSGLHAKLRTACREHDHDAIKRLLPATAASTRQRTEQRLRIEKHEFEAHPGGVPGEEATTLPDPPAPAAPASLALSDIEQAHIERVFREMDGNLSRAARALKIDRTTLYTKLRRYGLK